METLKTLFIIMIAILSASLMVGSGVTFVCVMIALLIKIVYDAMINYTALINCLIICGTAMLLGLLLLLYLSSPSREK